jgi:hypothetical protein
MFYSDVEYCGGGGSPVHPPSVGSAFTLFSELVLLSLVCI